MRTVMVRYRVKPEHVASNEQAVRRVYEELAQARPEGFRYATFKLDDGVSFVHFAFQEGERSPLADVDAFRRFQDGIGERCDEPPALSHLEQVGSFGFDGAAT